MRKAYKMYIGGAFVRSESGRYVQVDETMTAGERGTKENVPRDFISRATRKKAPRAARAADTADYFVRVK